MCNTVEPLLTDTSIILTPLCDRQFTWSLRDQNTYRAYFSKIDTSIVWTNNPVQLIGVRTKEVRLYPVMSDETNFLFCFRIHIYQYLIISEERQILWSIPKTENLYVILISPSKTFRELVSFNKVDHVFSRRQWIH